MRTQLGLSLIGLVLGVLFLPGGVGSALTCSDIEMTYSSQFSPCQQVGTWDDESLNRYTNNHATDDITLAFIFFDYTDNVVVGSGEPNIPYTADPVEHQTTSVTFAVRAKRVDDCEVTEPDNSQWKTKVSLSGPPVCENTLDEFSFTDAMNCDC